MQEAIVARDSVSGQSRRAGSRREYRSDRTNRHRRLAVGRPERVRDMVLGAMANDGKFGHAWRANLAALKETSCFSGHRASCSSAVQGPLLLLENTFPDSMQRHFPLMLRRLRRYGEVYAIMLRNSIIREMAFKANFLLWMGVELLWFIGQIVFIEVIFSYVQRIVDWTKWEVVLLVGTHQLIGQIFQAFFYSNLANLPELIRTGRFDFMLLQPIDTQFAVSTKQFGLDNLVNALIGVAFVVTALVKLAVMPTPVQVGLYLPRCYGRDGALRGPFARGDQLLDRPIPGVDLRYYSLFNLGAIPTSSFAGSSNSSSAGSSHYRRHRTGPSSHPRGRLSGTLDAAPRPGDSHRDDRDPPVLPQALNATPVQVHDHPLAGCFRRQRDPHEAMPAPSRRIWRYTVLTPNSR